MANKLVLYFAAQVLYIPFVWGTYLTVGLGRLYGVVYSIATGMVLLSVAGIAWESLYARKYRAQVIALTFILASAATETVYLELHRRADWFDWVLLVEGGILLWAGTLLACMAGHWKRSVSLFGLAIYWIFEAAFDFGFCMNWPRWLPLNAWVPPAAAALAYSLILAGLLSRQRPNSQPAVRAS